MIILQIILNNIEIIALTFNNQVSVEQIKNQIIEICQFPKEAVYRIEVDGITQNSSYVLISQPKMPIKANFQFKSTIGFFNKFYKTFYHKVDLCQSIIEIQKDISRTILPIDYSLNIISQNKQIYLNSYQEVPQQLEFNVEANFYINFKDAHHNFKINPFQIIKDIKLMISKFLNIEIVFTLSYNKVPLNEQDQYIYYHIPDHSKINIELQTRIKILVQYNNIVHQYSNLRNQKFGEFKNRMRQIYQIPQYQNFQLFYLNNLLENDQECISNLFIEDNPLITLKETQKIIKLTLQDLYSQEKFHCQVQSIDLVSSLTKQSFFQNKQVIFYYHKQKLIINQSFEQIQINSDNFTIDYHIKDERYISQISKNELEINQCQISFYCKIDQIIYFKQFSKDNTIIDAKCIFSKSLQKPMTSFSIFQKDLQLKDDQLLFHFQGQELFIYETKLISFHIRNGHVLKQKYYKSCMKVKEIKSDFQIEISQQSCKYEFNKAPIDENKLLSEITDQTEIVLYVDFQHNLKLINYTLEYIVQFYPTEIVSSIFSKYFKGNLQYYYNGQLIDTNKSFEDNHIQNNSQIYCEQIYTFTLEIIINKQIIQIQIISLNTKIKDAIQPIIEEKYSQKFQSYYNNRLINLEKTFNQEHIKEGIIQIELQGLIVKIYDNNKIYTYKVPPNLSIGNLNALTNKNKNKRLFKLDDEEILQDNIELSTLKQSNGEVELIYQEQINQDIILTNSIDFIPTQNSKTLEIPSLVLTIEFNNEKLFETVKLDQKVEEFLRDFQKQKKISKIWFFQDGEVIDINKRFEDLRVQKSSNFEIISD